MTMLSGVMVIVLGLPSTGNSSLSFTENKTLFSSPVIQQRFVLIAADCVIDK